MTLQNLRYVIEIAKHRSLSKAAKELYMSQSALSAAVRELEDELGIHIFVRTNRGVSLTPDGEDCIRYCKEIVERSDYLAIRYQERGSLHTYFSVSCQHLPFAVRAFDEFLAEIAADGFDAAIRETSTSAVMHDVSAGKSELGIVAFMPGQLSLIQKSLYIRDLEFTELAGLDTFVFVRRRHPLADRESLSLEDLRDYPFVTYDQDDAPNYYTEESMSFEPLKKRIHVSDRATKMSVIRSTDAFSIGADLPNFNADIYFRNRKTEIAAIPFSDQSEQLTVGYLSKAGHDLSDLAADYLALLDKHIELLKPPVVYQQESK